MKKYQKSIDKSEGRWYYNHIKRKNNQSTKDKIFHSIYRIHYYKLIIRIYNLSIEYREGNETSERIW